MLTIFEKKQLGIWEEPERGGKRPETEPQVGISPKSGWKIEKAAREVFNRLQRQKTPQ